MEILNADILQPNYTKKILILGMIIEKRKIFDNVESINQVLFLTSHNKKYQINCEGIINDTNSEKLLEISMHEVNEFKINNNTFTKFFACDTDEKNGIEILLKKFEIEKLNFNSKENEKLFNDTVCKNLELLKNPKNIVISSNVFTIILDETKLEKKQCFGLLEFNKKYLTRCSEKEMEEILDIKHKKTKNKELEK